MSRSKKESWLSEYNLTPKQVAFLAAYAEVGTVTHAATCAEVSRRSHCRWIKDSEEYKEAFNVATTMAADSLEREARRRAIEGIEEPVWHRGEQCGVVRKYSDTLLIFLMKGAMPEKYADRQKLDANHTGNAQIVVELPDNGRG